MNASDFHRSAFVSPPETGSHVSFVGRGGVRVHGLVLSTGPSRALVRCTDGKQWRVDFTGLKREEGPIDVPVAAPPDPRIGVAARVSWMSKGGRAGSGVVLRVNGKSATVRCEQDGKEWRISLGMLRVATLVPKVIPAFASLEEAVTAARVAKQKAYDAADSAYAQAVAAAHDMFNAERSAP